MTLTLASSSELKASYPTVDLEIRELLLRVHVIIFALPWPDERICATTWGQVPVERLPLLNRMPLVAGAKIAHTRVLLELPIAAIWNPDVASFHVGPGPGRIEARSLDQTARSRAFGS